MKTLPLFAGEIFLIYRDFVKFRFIDDELSALDIKLDDDAVDGRE